MSRKCYLTGKKTIIGNKISHANNKNKRHFNVNLKRKRFFLEEKKKWITLKVSTSAIRIIDKMGIKYALQKFGKKF